MNLRPGIDTPPPSDLLLVKLNIPFDDRKKVIEMLKAIENVRNEAMSPDRTHGVIRDTEGQVLRDKKVVEDIALNLNVGFGLRFFMGDLSQRKNEELVPNFPPAGIFTPRIPTRFGMTKRNVPLYLRTMNALGDQDWMAKKLKRENKCASPDEVDKAYQEWLAKSESDLILYIESNDRYLNLDLWKRLNIEVVKAFGLVLTCPLQFSFAHGHNSTHIGWKDPISNLQDKIKDDPQYYRSKIYLPHPAPGFPGEPTKFRDAPCYNGGTYMVHRKYVEHLDTWTSDDFEITDYRGCKHKGEEARRRAIGRDRKTGKVICPFSNKLLDREKDSTETHLAIQDSHIIKARGGNPAPFVGPFPPLKKGEENVFNIQDVRIRRRGAGFCEVDDETGEVTSGLHFICFQNNIQQTGFEFINNIWLQNPCFRGSIDHLLSVDNEVIEPVDGCYYFVPPVHRDYPGEVFFEEN